MENIYFIKKKKSFKNKKRINEKKEFIIIKKTKKSSFKTDFGPIGILFTKIYFSCFPCHSFTPWTSQITLLATYAASV
jgi:uncharacterized membrane protein YsdA (DUF1294 family)